MASLEQLRFPIGPFTAPEVYHKEVLSVWIGDIQVFPSVLKKETLHLSNEQLDTPYRLGGWSIRQVIHHCADSHMNSFMRFKWALTEDKPIIKPYWEDRWAELADTKTMAIQPSLLLLEGLHERWSTLLNTMTEIQFLRTFVYPEHGREISLRENTALYSWHCRHHLAHITHLKKTKAWV